MVRRDVRVGGQRHEGGRGADGVERPVFGEGVEDDPGLEAVGEDQRARAVEAGGELADHPGDVEQRCHREVHGRLGQREAGPLPLGVVHDVAVRVGGSLGGAAGARGVADQRDVGRAEGAVAGCLVPVPGDGEEVVGRLVHGQSPEGQHAFVIAGLEVPFAGRQDDAYGRVCGGLAQIRVPGAVGADEGDRLGVVQDVPDLAGLVHRVDRHDRRAGLPRAEQGEHEVRGVLEHDRHAVAAFHAPGGEVPGHGVAQLVEFAVAQPSVEVGERGAVRGVRDDVREGVHQGVGGVHRTALRLAEQGRPGPVGVAGHSAVSHFCWRWFMFVIQRSGSAARAW